jgi:hypothetical protein
MIQQKLWTPKIFHHMDVTQYFVTTDDVHLSSIIQSIQVMIVEEEPFFERRKTCKIGHSLKKDH